jgi:hypothetical protein
MFMRQVAARPAMKQRLDVALKTDLRGGGGGKEDAKDQRRAKQRGPARS